MQKRRLEKMVWGIWILGLVYFGDIYRFHYLTLGLCLSVAMWRNQPNGKMWPWVRSWDPYTSRWKASVQRVLWIVAVICIFAGALVQGWVPKSIWLGLAILLWLSAGRRYPAHAPAPMDV